MLREGVDLVLSIGTTSVFPYIAQPVLMAAAMGLPTIEIHLTNVYQREEFRHTSFISKAALGVIVGLGSHGYVLGLQALNYHLSRSNQE